MSDGARPHSALAADLEATVEVLTRLITEVQSGGASVSPEAAARLERIVAAVQARPQLAALPGALLRIYNEIMQALNGIRLTRETIQHQALDQLRDTQERLSQVSTTTESAAMEMMNGLDRTLAVVDALEAGADAERQAQLESLRGELNELFGHLQFQDIITQQLRGITTLLEDVEGRMGRVADLLDHSLGAPVDVREAKPVAAGYDADHNPDAQWEPTVAQSEIDAAFRAA